jgi:methyl-accepting chemotaxis protein
MFHWLPFQGHRVKLEALRRQADQMKEWFESAMIMVDNVPVGVAWGDAQNDFVITYVNATGKAMLSAATAKNGDGFAGQALTAVFPTLAARKHELADPARMPIHLHVALGALVLDLRIVAIKNGAGVYTGAMAVWSDITKRAKLADDFAANVKAVVEDVVAAATRIQSTAESLATTAGRAKATTVTVSAAASDATSNVQAVAAATEELSASIAEIGRQVVQSAAITSKAVEEANRTDKTVQSLAAAAEEIGKVVGLIQDIASQTNLLALNATIEAARAGEAGRGFAIVASEVKSLAAQTAKATDDIRVQIESIQSISDETVRTIKHIGTTIGEANDIAAAITASVEQQGAATTAIAQNVSQAAAGTTEVSHNIAGAVDASSDVGTAATQMLETVGDLSKRSGILRREVDGFLATIRTA